MEDSMRIAAGFLVGLLILAGVAGIATHAYHLGVTHGALAAQVVPPAGAPVPPVPFGYYGPYFYHGPFGFAGFLFPLALLVLALALLGRVFGRRRAWWARGCYGDPTAVPPLFAEWHRRAHEAAGKSETGAT
jgi:hypothetical protein